MKRLYAHVGSRNPSLQQRPEVLKAVGMYAAIHVLRSVVNNLVSVIGCQSFIREQGVSIERRASFHVLANFRLQCILAAIRHDGSANLSPALHDSYDSGLVLPACSGDAPLTFAQVHVSSLAADERFIDFDFATIATEFAAKELILQGKPNAMEHEPCGLLGNLEIAGNFVATDSVLAVRKHP